MKGLMIAHPDSAHTNAWNAEPSLRRSNLHDLGKWDGVRPQSEDQMGQRSATVPRTILREWLEHAILRNLLPTEVGYAPKAGRYRRESPGGADCATFVYCAKGRGWCEVGGRRHVVRTGDLLVIPAGFPHSYGSETEDPWTIAWVQVLGANLDFFLNQLDVTVQEPVCELGENPQLIALFHESINILDKAESFLPRLLYASQTLAHLIGTMIWLRARNVRNEPDVTGKIEQSVAYMTQHLNKPVQVATLAALANMSASHYTAMFKRQTGCAPIDYFIRLRMRHACQLLESSMMSVKEIAATLGYDDPFYFSRMFKAVNHVAPSDYRAMRRLVTSEPLAKTNCAEAVAA
jgi:AraC family transcriptional regulator of arabinose operon